MKQKNKCLQEVINTKRDANAFTIVELIVALSVLSTAVVAVFGTISICSTAAHHSRMLTRAVLLAENQLVDTRLLSNANFEVRQGSSGRFKWKVHIVPTEIENLAAIKVEIDWNEQQRQQHYELISLMKMKSFEQNKFY